MYQVYLITNNINGKVYVGRTKTDIIKYFESHLSAANKNSDNGKRPFYNAIRKYGRNNFLIKVLFSSSSLRKANDKEKEYIKLYKSKGISYNVASGGDGGDTMSNHPRKIEIYKKREKTHPHLPTYGMKGKHHSEKAVKKIRATKVGNRNPMYGRTNSKKMRELHSRRMSNAGNPSAKEFIVISPTGNLTTEKCVRKFVKDNDFSIVTFRRYFNRGEVQKPNTHVTLGRDKVERMVGYQFMDAEKVRSK